MAMIQHYRSHWLPQLNMFDTGCSSRSPARKQIWTPIQYSSLRGFYLLNYSTLFLLMSLPILVLLWWAL